MRESKRAVSLLVTYSKAFVVICSIPKYVYFPLIGNDIWLRSKELRNRTCILFNLLEARMGRNPRKLVGTYLTYLLLVAFFQNFEFFGPLGLWKGFMVI